MKKIRPIIQRKNCHRRKTIYQNLQRLNLPIIIVPNRKIQKVILKSYNFEDFENFKSRNYIKYLLLTGGVCSMLCRAFTSLIMWSAFFALFTITALAIFPIYDEQRSEEFFKYAETQTGIPLKYYHHEGIRLLETFMDSAKLWTNHTRGLIEKTYREYFVEQATTTSDKKEF